MAQELLQLIRADRKPALGVTEPAAIALACAAARELSEEEPESVELLENSGMYKNAYTCGLPGTDKVGNLYAAAAGFSHTVTPFLLLRQILVWLPLISASHRSWAVRTRARM